MHLNIKTQGSGPPLVLLHGWGFSSAVWDAVLPRLSADFTTYTVDLPGHGASAPWTGTTMSLDGLADVMLDRLPPQAHWLGWSLGGLISLTAALRRPEYIKGLALINTTKCFIRSFSWKHGLAQESLQDLRTDLVSMPKAALKRFADLCALGGDCSRETVRGLNHILEHQPLPDTGNLLEYLDILASTDLRPRLSELKCPALWIFGEADRLVSVATAAVLEQGWPDTRTAIIAGAGHAPLVSHPQALIERVLEFLHE